MKVIIPGTTVAAGGLTRATTGTYFDSNGIVQTAAINTIRINYDSTDLTAPPSALAEPAATNLVLFSEQFDNAAWTKSNTSITANTTTAPDGNATADKLAESATNTPHLMYQTRTGSNEVVTVSGFIKPAGRTVVRLGFSNFSTVSCAAVFNLANGTIASVDSGNADYSSPSATIKACPNGWFRCTFSVAKGSVNTTNTAQLDLFPSVGSGATYLGDGTSGVFVWGFQVETGLIASSYIPTTTIAVTRAADVVTNGLVYTNVPINDYPVWSSATTYNINDNVVFGTNVYNSLRATNTNHNPATDTSNPPYWLLTGPVNAYEMFDNVVGTVTTNPGNITVVLRNGFISGVGLLQLVGDSVKISVSDGQTVLYSKSINLANQSIIDWYHYFTDPITKITDTTLTGFPVLSNPIITVVITAASGNASCGTFSAGNVFEFVNTTSGLNTVESTTASPTIGIIDYSTKNIDTFGNVSVTPRGFAKRMNIKLMMDSNTVDIAASTLASIRAKPCVWIGAGNTYQSMIVFGYYKDWEIEIAYPSKSYCNLQIEGLV